MKQNDFGGAVTDASGTSDPIFPDSQYTEHSFSFDVSTGTPTITLYGSNDTVAEIDANPGAATWISLGVLSASGALDYTGAMPAYRYTWATNTGTITPKVTSK